MKVTTLDLNNGTVHFYTCTVCNKIHVVSYVIHHPCLIHSSVKPGPITSLQFSLAGFGDLCHISGQCRTRKVWQSDLVLVHLTNSLHQCRHKVGLGVPIVAAEDESLASLRVDRRCPGIPVFILPLLSRGVVPVDGSQHQTRRHH